MSDLVQKVEWARRRLIWPALREGRALGLRIGVRRESSRKVFCVGMQRSGTTSFGDFCEGQLGLPRCGLDKSLANGWREAWHAGDFDRIFTAPDFTLHAVFDDDPWWYPGFFREIHRRCPEARFVLLTRDSDAWFRSMLAHSGGRSLSPNPIHARIYGREAELEARFAGADRRRLWSRLGFALAGEDARYKAVYETHAADVRAYFADNAPDQLLDLRLEDRDKFRKIAVFLGYEDREYDEVRSNVIASKF